jgi:plasmid stabilization system protein ParE
MATIRLSQAALEDFDRVIDHLRDVSSRAVAAEYAEQIQAKINLLADFPGAGTPRAAFGYATRVASVEPYLIFYDGGPQSEVVHVLRILHGHRNITPELIARGRQP